MFCCYFPDLKEDKSSVTAASFCKQKKLKTALQGIQFNLQGMEEKLKILLLFSYFIISAGLEVILDNF